MSVDIFSLLIGLLVGAFGTAACATWWVAVLVSRAVPQASAQASAVPLSSEAQAEASAAHAIATWREEPCPVPDCPACAAAVRAGFSAVRTLPLPPQEAAQDRTPPPRPSCPTCASVRSILRRLRGAERVRPSL